MQKDEQSAPSPDSEPGQRQASENAREEQQVQEDANLQVQEDAAKEREESRGYQ